MLWKPVCIPVSIKEWKRHSLWLFVKLDHKWFLFADNCSTPSTLVREFLPQQFCSFTEWWMFINVHSVQQHMHFADMIYHNSYVASCFFLVSVEHVWGRHGLYCFKNLTRQIPVNSYMVRFTKHCCCQWFHGFRQMKVPSVEFSFGHR